MYSGITVKDSTMTNKKITTISNLTKSKKLEEKSKEIGHKAKRTLIDQEHESRLNDSVEEDEYMKNAKSEIRLRKL